MEAGSGDSSERPKLALTPRKATTSRPGSKENAGQAANRAVQFRTWDPKRTKADAVDAQALSQVVPVLGSLASDAAVCAQVAVGQAPESKQREASFNVIVRVRPQDPQPGMRRILDVDPARNEVVLKEEDSDRAIRTYCFDTVVPESATQEEMFVRCGAANLVEKALQGYNCTIFAYGKTSSGKTHTMIGDLGRADGAGLVPRVAELLFSRIERETAGAKQGWLVEFEVSVSMTQLLNEQFYDLLDDQGKKLDLRDTGSVFIQGLREVRVQTARDLLSLLADGASRRTTKRTTLNDESSRSHAIFCISIKKTVTEPPTKLDDEEEATKTVVTAKLNLVDLAGSESLQEGSAKVESVSINKSLLTLNLVTASLVKRQAYIPYRDSKLTHILKDSLGGNALTLMIACVHPCSDPLNTSKRTLDYADGAKQIKNAPKKNEKGEKTRKRLLDLQAKSAGVLKALDDLVQVWQGNRAERSLSLALPTVDNAGGPTTTTQQQRQREPLLAASSAGSGPAAAHSRMMSWNVYERVGAAPSEATAEEQKQHEHTIQQLLRLRGVLKYGEQLESEHNKLLASLSAAEDKVAALESENASLASENVRAREAVESARQESSVVQDALAKQGTELDLTKVQLRQARLDMQTLESELATFRERVVALEKESTRANSVIEKYSQTFHDYKHTTQNEKKDLEERLSKTRSAITALERQLQTQAEEGNRLQSALKAKEAELEAATRHLAEITSDRSKMERELLEAMEEGKALREALKAADDERTRLAALLRTAQTQSERKDVLAKEAMDAAAGLQARLQQSEGALEESRSRVEVERTEKERIFEQLQKALVEAQESIALRASFAQATAERDALSAKLEGSLQALSKATQECDAQCAASAAAEAQRSALQQALLAAQRKDEEMTMRISSLEAENATLVLQRDHLERQREAELAEALQRREQVEKSLVAEREKVAAGEAMIHAAQAEASEARKRVHSIESSTSLFKRVVEEERKRSDIAAQQLQRECEQLEAASAALSAQLREQVAQCERLQREKDELVAAAERQVHESKMREEAMAQLDAANAALRRSVERSAEDVKNLMAQLESAHQQRDEIERTRSQLAQEVAAARARMEELSILHAREAERALSAEKALQGGADAAEKARLLGAIQVLQVEVLSLTASRDRAELELRARIRDLEHSLAARAADNSALAMQLATLQQESSEWEAKLQSLTATLEQAQAAMAESRASHAATNLELNNARAALECLQAEIAEHKQTEAELRQRLEEEIVVSAENEFLAKRAGRERDEQVSSLQHRLDAALAQIEHREAMVREEARRLAEASECAKQELEANVQLLRHQADDFKSRLDAACVRYEIAESELAHLKAEAAASALHAQEREAELAEMGKELASTAEKYTAAAVENAGLVSLVSALRGENGKLSTSLDEQVAQIREMMAQMESAMREEKAEATAAAAKQLKEALSALEDCKDALAATSRKLLEKEDAVRDLEARLQATSDARKQLESNMKREEERHTQQLERLEAELVERSAQHASVQARLEEEMRRRQTGEREWQETARRLEQDKVQAMSAMLKGDEVALLEELNQKLEANSQLLVEQQVVIEELEATVLQRSKELLEAKDAASVAERRARQEIDRLQTVLESAALHYEEQLGDMQRKLQQRDEELSRAVEERERLVSEAVQKQSLRALRRASIVHGTESSPHLEELARLHALLNSEMEKLTEEPHAESKAGAAATGETKPPTATAATLRAEPGHRGVNNESLVCEAGGEDMPPEKFGDAQSLSHARTQSTFWAETTADLCKSAASARLRCANAEQSKRDLANAVALELERMREEVHCAQTQLDAYRAALVRAGMPLPAAPALPRRPAAACTADELP